MYTQSSEEKIISNPMLPLDQMLTKENLDILREGYANQDSSRYPTTAAQKVTVINIIGNDDSIMLKLIIQDINKKKDFLSHGCYEINNDKTNRDSTRFKKFIEDNDAVKKNLARPINGKLKYHDYIEQDNGQKDNLKNCIEQEIISHIAKASKIEFKVDASSAKIEIDLSNYDSANQSQNKFLGYLNKMINRHEEFVTKDCVDLFNFKNEICNGILGKFLGTEQKMPSWERAKGSDTCVRQRHLHPSFPSDALSNANISLHEPRNSPMRTLVNNQ